MAMLALPLTYAPQSKPRTNRTASEYPDYSTDYRILILFPP
jgi:hypothetical protein